MQAARSASCSFSSKGRVKRSILVVTTPPGQASFFELAEQFSDAGEKPCFMAQPLCVQIEELFTHRKKIGILGCQVEPELYQTPPALRDVRPDGLQWQRGKPV